jgi:hypothetical protein
MLITIIVLMIMIMIMLMIMLMLMLMLMLMRMLMLMLMLMLMRMIMRMIMIMIIIMVFLDTLVFPVSPWTLRAPDQLVRYLRPSVGLVLGGQTCILWKNLCARQTEFIAQMFFKWAFF